MRGTYMNNTLNEKIGKKKAAIGVIGLGYVGLPLAVEIAKAGYRTIGYDVKTQKVEMVNESRNYIEDVDPSDLEHVVKSGRLRASSDFESISSLDCVIMCVPTPLDEYFQPDITYIINASEQISKYMHKDMLIILESTTYPGTTEDVVRPILEKSGLECGKDFYLVFSPERIDPGNKLYKTRNTPKVVGGVTPACTEIAALLYSNVLDSEILKVSSPKVAEMEKIHENTFRNVNIALANEMAIICDKMGIDVWEVIEAAKTKPYGFMPFYPGAGVGGHCIAVDPFYLTWKTREYGYHTKLIETAGEINNSMPEFVLDRTMKILNRFGKALNGSKVLVLGAAYKPDINDVRESPALKVIDLLVKNGAVLDYNDPYVQYFKYKGREYHSVTLNTEILQEADIVIITTAHSDYDYDFIQRNSKLIFDTKNVMKSTTDKTNIEKL
jgi:UDP-N-acetyl-D-glucosamine dehydrogenase